MTASYSAYGSVNANSIKAAKSVIFDLILLEIHVYIRFLIFKNTVVYLKFGFSFYQLRKP